MIELKLTIDEAKAIWFNTTSPDWPDPNIWSMRDKLLEAIRRIETPKHD
jgi:hypothetical protein